MAEALQNNPLNTPDDVKKWLLAFKSLRTSPAAVAPPPRPALTMSMVDAEIIKKLNPPESHWKQEYDAMKTARDSCQEEVNNLRAALSQFV